ncbi:MAG TPA: serine hydrolase domain-containing protein [Vicinamibacterales bacterium]|nr:serine hydrolase domain-containing protein [Vicinamibacterales bacterium]
MRSSRSISRHPDDQNEPYALAGVAIERATGQPYGTYVKKEVFAPLGMPTASLCTVHDTVANLANGYVAEKGGLEPAPSITWSLPFAAGAICATAADLITWQQALENGRVISPAGLARMRTPSRLNDGTTIDYGLGTRMGTLERHRVFGHTGSGGGYKIILESFPDDGVMIAVLSNTETASVAAVAGALARAALGLEPREPTDSPVPPAEALAIAGTFDSDEGPIELFTCADRICFRSPDGAVRGTQKRRAPFAYDVGPEVVVRFDRRVGRPDWVFVYSAGLLTDGKRRTK